MPRSALSRRHFLRTAALGACLRAAPAFSAQSPSGAPKLCMGMNYARFDEKRLQFMRQLGIEWLFMWGPGAPTYSPQGRVVPRQGDHSPPQGPWSANEIRGIRERVEKAGLQLHTMMLHDFRDVILGRPGRDAAIDRVQQSLRAAGKAGLRVVEYNFYALRSQQGYSRVPGRGGAEYLAYDYERVRQLPPLPEVGEHPAEALWERYEYFLKAVIPVAEEAGVVMAVHPNDPPAPLYRGCAQILGNMDGLRRLAGTVRSPANGITFDTGVTREWGLDPVEWIPWFGERKQINHVHFRNVVSERPGLKYREVFLDEGEVDMLAAMKALYAAGYDKAVYPDHVPAMSAEGGGRDAAWAHAVGHIQALSKAAREN